MAPDSQTQKLFLILLGFTLLLTTVYASQIDASVEDSFNAYQDHQMGEGDSKPIIIDFSGLDNESETLTSSNFSVSKHSNFFQNDEIDKEWKEDPQELILRPSIKDEANSGDIALSVAYQNGTGPKVNFTHDELTGNGEKVQLNVSEPWEVEIISKAFNGRVLDAEDLLKDFSYKIQLYYLGQKSKETNEVYTSQFQNNFEVDVEKHDGSNFDKYPDDDPYEGKNWTEVTQLKPDQTNGLYRLEMAEKPSEEFETGAYRFDVNLVFDQNYPYKGDYGDVIQTYVNKYMTFSGQVRNVILGTGIKTDIILNGNVQKTIFSTENGDYSKELVPKTWNSANLQFYPEGQEMWDTEVIVGEPEIKDSSGAIKHHYVDWSGGTPDLGVKGVTPANLMAVEFSYPIQSAKMSVEYDTGEVTSDEMVIMECSSWNFEKARDDLKNGCQEEWERVSDEKISLTYSEERRANFPAEVLHQASKAEGGSKNILMNAYIVGTSADLVLNGGLTISGPENGRVATGSEITVEGNINSENEKAVEGADVEVSFHQGDTEISTLETAETDVTGRFIAKGEAPEEPGNYSVKITADKENYNMLEKKFDNRFETFIKEGISLETGGTVKAKPGEDAAADITVKNTGQTDMEDVSLKFEGMDSKYYSVSEAGFDEISAGEEETTTLTVSLPSDYCDNGCGDWPTLELSATGTNPEGEEFEAGEETLQVQISRTTNEQTSSEGQDTGQATSQTDDTNGSGSGFTESVSELENATGEFLASQSSLNLALGLIMVFMMVIAGAVKKEDNNSRSGRRSSRTERNGRDGRPRIQKPSVAGESEVNSVNQETDDMEKHIDSHAEAIADSVSEEDENEDRPHVKHVESEENENSEEEIKEDEVVEKEDGEKKFVCEETGEEFDTETALKLHKKMNGLL